MGTKLEGLGLKVMGDQRNTDHLWNPESSNRFSSTKMTLALEPGDCRGLRHLTASDRRQGD